MYFLNRKSILNKLEFASLWAKAGLDEIHEHWIINKLYKINDCFVVLFIIFALPNKHKNMFHKLNQCKLDIF